MLLMYNH